MDECDWPAERPEENGTHLRAVAYRMLGSPSEADGAVQESWLRFSGSDASGVENLGGWLTTIVTRVCLDMLRSRKSRSSRTDEPAGVAIPGSFGRSRSLQCCRSRPLSRSGAAASISMRAK